MIGEEWEEDWEEEEEIDNEKKRKIDVLNREDQSSKSSSIKKKKNIVSGSLDSLSSIKVDTFAGKDQGATFAVWNLCDLGGGHQSAHWKKNDFAALKKLPDELAVIKADVIGFLEIKTGHAIVAQLPKDASKTTAFEIGAITAWMFKWYIGRLKQDESQPKKLLSEIFGDLSKLMWVGEDTTFLVKGLMSAEDLDRKVCLDDLEGVVKDMIFNATNFLFNLTEIEVKEIYMWMTKRCSWTESSWYKNPTIDLDDLTTTKQISNFWLGKKDYLNQTWKYAQKAFENAGTRIEGEEKTPKEANGIPLITEVLKNFVKTNKNYKYCIIDEVKGDGETTAFVYDENKFDLCCRGSIGISGFGWRFRSAGYIHLKCKPETLNKKELMVVAWHAPSENNVGERQQAYSTLNFKLEDRTSIKDCLKETNVVLLADMNIRSLPALCEVKIKEEAYNCWLPKVEDHMKLCTSLKKTGTMGSQWNHPFDKVLLLKNDKDELEITGYERMKDSRSAEEIRFFSDHSWVKAKLSLKK
ncbi:hypothetical protein BH10ACI1_BH10ACI1_29870 [soil metagenome]